VNGVNNPASYQGDCTPFTDWQNYNSTMKQALMNYALASMDSLHHWSFWTWKVGVLNLI